MGVTSGTVSSVELLRGPDESDVQWAHVLFTVSGTYDTSANSILTGVPTLIQNSKRNGKTVTMRAVTSGQPGRRLSDNSIYWAKTVAISSSDVTFELVNNSDYSTEYTNSTAVATFSAPMGIFVAYTEA